MSTSLNPSAHGYIKSHAIELESIPSPDKTWIMSDVGIDQSILKKLIARNLITKVSRVNTPLDYENKVWEYRIDEDAYYTLQEILENKKENPGFLPCGHDGFRTRSKGIICMTCDSVWSKDEVKNHNEQNA